MSYKINYTPFFEREFKKLSKKYVSLKQDLEVVISILNTDPRSGEPIGNDCYKIRMRISAKNKGKSGGARIITHVKFIDDEIFLLSVYDKSDLSTMAEEQILARIKNLR